MPGLQLKGYIYIYSRQLIERQTFGGMLVISKYPPLCPHSPQYPLDTVWKETSWSSLLMGGPISLKTFQCYSKLEYKYNLKLHAKTQDTDRSNSTRIYTFLALIKGRSSWYMFC